jgi:Ca2+-binding EF-hand superfamily protein
LLADAGHPELEDDTVEAIKMLVDTDGNNEIDFEEFLRWWPRLKQFESSNFDQKLYMLTVAANEFRKCDTSHRNRLNTLQFLHAFRELSQHNITAGDVEVAMKELLEIEQNLVGKQDGMISFHSFVKWLRWFN